MSNKSKSFKSIELKTKLVDCGRCGGHGHIRLERCHICGGKGYRHLGNDGVYYAGMIAPNAAS